MITVKVGDKPRSFLLTAGLVTALCLPRLTAVQGKPVLVPIYDQIEPNILTLGPAYRISGFAPFVVTGYSGLIGGLTKSLTGLLGGSVPATIDGLGCGLSFCISGYFTQTVSPVPRPQFGTGKDYGAVVVGRTG